MMVAIVLIGASAGAEAPKPSVAQQIGDEFEKFMRAFGPPRNPLMRRPVFAKSHGCVKAKFTVNPKLKPKHKIGAFTRGEYNAWIRFSNDSAYGPDTAKVARGMAVKLVGVLGKKILKGEEDAFTQDFVMENHPVFFVNTAQDFLDFLMASSDPQKKKVFDALHPETQRVLDDMDKNLLADPLDGQYWTPTPYRFGPDVIKYTVKPCAKLPDTDGKSSPDAYTFCGKPPDPKSKPMEGDNYLRENLVEHLKLPTDTYMGFFVQFRTTEEKMPIDKAVVKWPEEGPGNGNFELFATLTIPTGQDVNDPDRQKICEDLSFTGWHATPEMEPVGSLNIVRGEVYKRMADIRRKANNPNDPSVLVEPTTLSLD